MTIIYRSDWLEIILLRDWGWEKYDTVLNGIPVSVLRVGPIVIRMY